MTESSREFLIERINKLEAAKSKQNMLIGFQRDTIVNLRKTTKQMTMRIKELTKGI